MVKNRKWKSMKENLEGEVRVGMNELGSSWMAWNEWVGKATTFSFGLLNHGLFGFWIGILAIIPIFVFIIHESRLRHLGRSRSTLSFGKINITHIFQNRWKNVHNVLESLIKSTCVGPYTVFSMAKVKIPKFEIAFARDVCFTDN